MLCTGDTLDLKIQVVKVKGWKRMGINYQKVGVAILIDKIDLKTKYVIRNKRGQSVMMSNTNDKQPQAT